MLKYSLIIALVILGWLSAGVSAGDLFVLQQSNNKINGTLESLYEQRWPAEPFEKESQLFKNSLGVEADTLNRGYLWKPWFSSWNFDGKFKLEETINAFQESNSTTELFGSGSSELSIFPSSRFPFRARISHLDSRTESAVDDKIQQSLFGVYQTYQPVSKNALYQASVERHLSRIDGSGETTYDNVKLLANHTAGYNSFENNINWIDQENQNQEALGGDSFEQFQYFGKHTWRPEEKLNTDSFVSFVDDENSYSETIYKTKQWQATGTVNWAPNSQKPIRVVGSSRVRGESREVDSVSTTDNSTEFEEMFNRAAIYYDYTDNLRLNSEVTYKIDHSEVATHSSDQRVGYDYTPDRISFGVFDYEWYNSVLTSNRYVKTEGIDSEDSQLANVVISHSLMKDFLNRSDAPLISNFTQSANYNGTTESNDQSVMTLNHRFSLSRTQFEGGIYNYYQFSFDDVRDFGSKGLNENGLQIINLQLTHNEKIDRATGWNSDLSAQIIRNDDEERDRIQWFANGNVSYTNNRFLDVNRLNFRNQLLISHQDFLKDEVKNPDLVTGDTGAKTETSVESRLDYSIGMLRLESLLRISRNTNGNYDSFIRFHLERRFNLY